MPTFKTGKIKRFQKTTIKNETTFANCLILSQFLLEKAWLTSTVGTVVFLT